MVLAREHSSECTVKVAKLYPQIAVLRSKVGVWMAAEA